MRPPGSRILTQLQDAADQMRTVASADALANSAVGSRDVLVAWATHLISEKYGPEEC